MKKYLYLFTLFCSFASHADQAQDWLNQLDHPTNEEYQLKPENKKDEFTSYYFNEVLAPKSDFLGYIDPNFRRLKMFFNRIEKLSGDTYAVSGYSEVKGNPCDFSGTIKIEQVREYKTLHIGISGEAQSEGIVSQGIVIGKYEFNENKNQKYSGTFSGIMTANWYKNSDGLIKYDDINYYSDGYRNNQYIGTWQMYGSHKKKTANWGEYRIPFSDQLDIGTSEFKANPTYSKEGW